MKPGMIEVSKNWLLWVDVQLGLAVSDIALGDFDEATERLRDVIATMERFMEGGEE